MKATNSIGVTQAKIFYEKVLANIGAAYYIFKNETSLKMQQTVNFIINPLDWISSVYE